MAASGAWQPRAKNRVARWFVFLPKIPILEGLGMENVGKFYDHMEYFTAIMIMYGRLV
jgi:hypothetical protein